ncbi:MAG: trigger factor [Lachnospiraceae bacterium]
MSFQVEKKEHNMAVLTIEVSAQDLEKAIEGAYNKNKKQITIPGFRKGKAPRMMIEKLYGKGFFLEDAANAIIPQAYATAADESELEIVSQPEIDVTTLEPGQNFVFTAEVALKPDVELGEYKGLEVPKSDVEVTEEEIVLELAKEQEKNSRTITVEDRAAEDGDTVTIDFEGFVDDVAFEGGKGENHPLTLGSNSFIPGFEEQLVGVALETPVDVNVSFPEEYQAAELAGKAAVFKCIIHKIEKKELPELDDEFAQDASEFDTLAEYKEDIRGNLLKTKEESAKRAKEDAVVEKAIENAKFDIPEPMIKQQIRQLVEDFSRRVQSQGLSVEQYFQFSGLTPEKLEEQMRPQAEKRIQSRLVLEKIAEAEKIEPSQEDVDAELTKMAEMYKMEIDKIKEIMGENETKQLKQDLAVQQAVTLISDAANEVEMVVEAEAAKED